MIRNDVPALSILKQAVLATVDRVYDQTGDSRLLGLFSAVACSGVCAVSRKNGICTNSVVTRLPETASLTTVRAPLY